VEWIVVEFNSQHAFQPSGKLNFSLYAQESSGDRNTITLLAVVAKGCGRQAVSTVMEHSRKCIESLARLRRFDDWLIIQEQIETVE
jgi:hypothetical protein